MVKIVYVVVSKDRHSDDEYELHSREDTAIDAARSRVTDAAAHYRVDQKELNKDCPAGWLFYASLEDAFSIHVEECELRP